MNIEHYIVLKLDLLEYLKIFTRNSDFTDYNFFHSLFFISAIIAVVVISVVWCYLKKRKTQSKSNLSIDFLSIPFFLDKAGFVFCIVGDVEVLACICFVI